jgi:hypothetical protein
MKNEQLVTIDFDGWREYCQKRGLQAALWFNEGDVAYTNGVRRNGTVYVQSGCLSAYIPVRFVKLVKAS